MTATPRQAREASGATSWISTRGARDLGRVGGKNVLLGELFRALKDSISLNPYFAIGTTLRIAAADSRLAGAGSSLIKAIKMFLIGPPRLETPET